MENNKQSYKVKYSLLNNFILNATVVHTQLKNKDCQNKSKWNLLPLRNSFYNEDTE